jgi:hypothetical protein
MYSCHPTDSDLVVSLTNLLGGCVGGAKAMTIRDIADLLAVPVRLVEKAIEENIARFPFPLVADGAGYHVPTEPDEINRYAESLRGRCIRIFMRRRSVIRKAVACGFKREGKVFTAAPQQMELDLGVSAKGEQSWTR